MRIEFGCEYFNQPSVIWDFDYIDFNDINQIDIVFEYINKLILDTNIFDIVFANRKNEYLTVNPLSIHWILRSSEFSINSSYSNALFFSLLKSVSKYIDDRSLTLNSKSSIIKKLYGIKYYFDLNKSEDFVNIKPLNDKRFLYVFELINNINKEFNFNAYNNDLLAATKTIQDASVYHQGNDIANLKLKHTLDYLNKIEILEKKYKNKLNKYNIINIKDLDNNLYLNKSTQVSSNDKILSLINNLDSITNNKLSLDYISHTMSLGKEKEYIFKNDSYHLSINSKDALELNESKSLDSKRKNLFKTSIYKLNKNRENLNKFIDMYKLNTSDKYFFIENMSLVDKQMLKSNLSKPMLNLTNKYKNSEIDLSFLLTKSKKNINKTLSKQISLNRNIYDINKLNDISVYVPRDLNMFIKHTNFLSKKKYNIFVEKDIFVMNTKQNLYYNKDELKVSKNHTNINNLESYKFLKKLDNLLNYNIDVQRILVDGKKIETNKDLDRLTKLKRSNIIKDLYPFIKNNNNKNNLNIFEEINIKTIGSSKVKLNKNNIFILPEKKPTFNYKNPIFKKSITKIVAQETDKYLYKKTVNTFIDKIYKLKYKNKDIFIEKDNVFIDNHVRNINNNNSFFINKRNTEIYITNLNESVSNKKRNTNENKTIEITTGIKNTEVKNYLENVTKYANKVTDYNTSVNLLDKLRKVNKEESITFNKNNNNIDIDDKYLFIQNKIRKSNIEKNQNVSINNKRVFIENNISAKENIRSINLTNKGLSLFKQNKDINFSNIISISKDQKGIYFDGDIHIEKDKLKRTQINGALNSLTLEGKRILEKLKDLFIQSTGKNMNANDVIEKMFKIEKQLSFNQSLVNITKIKNITEDTLLESFVYNNRDLMLDLIGVNLTSIKNVNVEKEDIRISTESKKTKIDDTHLFGNSIKNIRESRTEICASKYNKEISGTNEVNEFISKVTDVTIKETDVKITKQNKDTKDINHIIVGVYNEVKELQDIIDLIHFATIKEIDPKELLSLSRTSLINLTPTEEEEFISKINYNLSKLPHIEMLSRDPQAKDIMLIDITAITIDDEFINEKANGTDELLLPNDDFNYGDLKELLFDYETGLPKNPVKTIDDTTFIGKFPTDHPLNRGSEIAPDYLEVELSVLKFILEIFYHTWQNRIFEYGMMDIKDAINKIMGYLEIFVEYRIPPNIQKEAWRAYKLIRWYAEKVIIENSQYRISYKYKPWKSNLHLKTLDCKHELNNCIITDKYIIQNTEQEGFITLHKKVLQDGFMTASIRAIGDYTVYVNNKEVYKGSSSTLLKVKLKEGASVITIYFNATLFKLGNIEIENCDFDDIITKYEYSPGKANFGLDKVMQRICAYYTITEANFHKYEQYIQGALGLRELSNYLLEYYEDHHKDKTKGKRITVKKGMV